MTSCFFSHQIIRVGRHTLKNLPDGMNFQSFRSHGGSEKVMVCCCFNTENMCIFMVWCTPIQEQGLVDVLLEHHPIIVQILEVSNRYLLS